jgi:hypothetical protein
VVKIDPSVALVNRARMEGFVVFDSIDRFPIAVGEIAQWMAQGRPRSREDIVERLDGFFRRHSPAASAARISASGCCAPDGRCRRAARRCVCPSESSLRFAVI